MEHCEILCNGSQLIFSKYLLRPMEVQLAGVKLTVDTRYSYNNWVLCTQFLEDYISSFCIQAVNIGCRLKHMKQHFTRLLMDVNLPRTHPVRNTFKMYGELRSALDSALFVVVGRAVRSVQTLGFDAMEITHVFSGPCNKSECNCKSPLGVLRGPEPFNFTQRRRLYALIVECDRILSTSKAMLQHHHGWRAKNSKIRTKALRIISNQQERNQKVAAKYTRWALVALAVKAYFIAVYIQGETQRRLCSQHGTGRKRDLEEFAQYCT